MINSDQTNAAQSTVGNVLYSNTCGFMLPCGYCTRLERPCPMHGPTTITWTSSNVDTPNIIPV